MAVEYKWPKFGTASLIGTEVDRTDGVAKATGAAKYAYDINPEGMLIARALGCPHAHCKIKSIETGAAEKVRGVKAVKTMKEVGNEIQWQGDLIAVVAAETEAAAVEGLAAIKVEYEMLDVFVDEENLAAAEAAKRTGKGGSNTQLEKEPGDDDDEAKFADKEIERLFKEAAVVVDAYYGIQPITHMCLEPHGSTCEWKDGKLIAHLSTQNVSGTPTQFAQPLKITADEVTVHCDFIGGGFGSKFAADTWGVMAAQISKETGRPVKFMLDRDQELKIAGNRPSAFINVKVGADKNGVITVWDSHHWGTAGMGAPGGIAQDTVPYVFNPKNRRRRQTTVATNTGPARAWRAPNHPQACAVTQTAFDDVAAKLGLDSFDVFMRNLERVSNNKTDVYKDQMQVAARLMDWKSKWHLHGKGPSRGSIVTGLGIGIHTWGGGGHSSTCNVKVHPDGGVELAMATQDLGTGTRTCVGMVVAETFGLPLSAVKVNIGNSKLPVSGPSGGSTTIGGVSESTRRASLDAIDRIFQLVAAKLGVDASTLEAKKGRIQSTADANKSLSWKEACSLLGMTPLETKGEYVRGTKDPKLGADSKLSSSVVAGVQMAEVAVDKETGVVKMKKFVAVQDMGLIINRQTAASQIYGAVIMGIAASLFEERIMDRKTGAFLNCEIADYKLPRLGDTGEIVVELYEPESEYNRGVVGLGEPPVIAPCAAISNAICNALGVRVPVLPATPKRVLEAIKKGREGLMKAFEYAAPRQEADVLELLSPEPGKTEILAGGTDLIGLMKKMILTPDRVVNIKEVASMRGVEADSFGVRIGAVTNLDDLLEAPELDDYPAVKQAIRGINSQQLQAQGTIGGELCQRPRCWYFRNGQGLLSASELVESGENRFHAIFGNGGPAKFVCPSRIAPALFALSAKVRIIGPDPQDEKVLPIAEFFQTPRHEGQRENVLLPRQMLTHIILPPAVGSGPSNYGNATYEVRQGAGADYPLAAAAANLEFRDGIVTQASVVLGQVAPVPWVSYPAAEALLGLPVNMQTARAAGEAAVASATPLSDNGYKVDLARVAVQRAILLAAGLETGGF